MDWRSIHTEFLWHAGFFGVPDTVRTYDLQLHREAMDWRSIHTEFLWHAGFFGVPDTVRTYDLQLRRLALYPTELRAHDISTLPLFLKAINYPKPRAKNPSTPTPPTTPNRSLA
jgi:hypothetical protein